MKKFIFVMAAAPLLLFAENVVENVRENVVNVKDNGSSINSGIDLGDTKGTLVGNGNTVTVKREVSSFDSIKTWGALKLNVNVSGGAAGSVEIITDSNITNVIKTEVKNGCLSVGASKSYSTEKPVTVKITVPALKNIDAGGACELTIDGSTKDFSATLGGVAKLHAAGLSASDVKISVSGAASAEVAVSGVLSVNGSGAAKVFYKGNPSKIVKELSGVASLENME